MRTYGRVFVVALLAASLVGQGFASADPGSPPKQTTHKAHHTTYKGQQSSPGGTAQPLSNSYNGLPPIDCDAALSPSKPTWNSVSAIGDDYCSATMSFLFIALDVQYLDPNSEAYVNLGGSGHDGEGCMYCPQETARVSYSNLANGFYRVHGDYTEEPPSGYTPPSNEFALDWNFQVTPP